MTRNFLAACFALVLLVAPCAAEQSKLPTIVFASQSADLGKVIEGQLAKHVFEFTNTGSATLQILGVDAPCGCTSTLLSEKQLAPGQRGKIEAAVKTEGNSGRLEKTVTVSTNDPRQPQVVLKITAHVEREFKLSMPTIYFGTVVQGTAAVREVSIEIPQDRGVKLLSVESSDAAVTAKLEPVGTGGKSFKVVATQKADAPEGYHFGNLVVKTTSVHTPQLRIPVRGMVTKVERAAGK